MRKLTYIEPLDREVITLIVRIPFPQPGYILKKSIDALCPT